VSVLLSYMNTSEIILPAVVNYNSLLLGRTTVIASDSSLSLNTEYRFLSMCWSHTCTLQKRLNRSRCCLGAELGSFKEPCIRWVADPPREGAIFGGKVVAHCKV